MPIKINNIFHTYFRKTPHEVKALRGVSHEFLDNSFTAVIGETGCGKSTLIQHLNALLLPDLGTIQVNDYLIQEKKRKNKKLLNLRKQIGLVFQFPEQQLFEETIIKDVMFGPKNFGASIEDARNKSIEALKEVGIPESYLERSPFELSGGERRKVAIAGILAIDPDILVLDEPTAGLDNKSSKIIMDLLVSLHKKGKTIILVTHNNDDVLNYANQVLYMKDGLVSFSGSPSELFSLKDLDLELPRVIKLANLLKQKGVKLDTSKIRNISDLYKELNHE